VFVYGITLEAGGYGTFWPGKLMAPLMCSGVDPGRQVEGTGTIWETLLSTGKAGVLVFPGSGGEYFACPINRNMYQALPDTTVCLTGSFAVGDLVNYPSCFTRLSSVDMGIFLEDSVFWMSPEEIDGNWCYDLASNPLWLTGETTVIVTFEGQLTFSGRNLSVEKALRVREVRANSLI
jgi:hypothetical protein